MPTHMTQMHTDTVGTNETTVVAGLNMSDFEGAPSQEVLWKISGSRLNFPSLESGLTPLNIATSLTKKITSLMLEGIDPPSDVSWQEWTANIEQSASEMRSAWLSYLDIHSGRVGGFSVNGTWDMELTAKSFFPGERRCGTTFAWGCSYHPPVNPELSEGQDV